MTNTLQIWEEAKGYLKKKIGETAFETWLLPLKASSGGEEELVLEAPDSFFRDWIEKNYKQLIKEALQNCGKPKVVVAIEINPAIKTTPAKSLSKE